ncbi:MAG: type II toxin-antitoxin system HicB family antitoxin [Candidatus Tectomicrobia bacterium]|nr:type II toxin-antitoxin system HicB family antitoxin [Candidatus Tectomicrobia bacterium]
MKSYVFHADLVQEDDGRWSAWVEALPGCATWGYSREEALRNIRDAVEAYLRDLQEAGEEMPRVAAPHELDEPVVAVTV